jgi:protein arginine kinase activator
MSKSLMTTCGLCAQPATVHVSWVKGHTAQTAAFCAAHATEAGVLDPQGYALLEQADPAQHRRSENLPRCPVCDCGQRDFERNGRFGCPACYGTFAGLLTPLLKRMHRGPEHRGKIPARGADPASLRHRLAHLQEELQDAVRAEHFEGAAQTRDAITALKAKLLSAAVVPPQPAQPVPAGHQRPPGADRDATD